MITGAQIRMARGYLRWSAKELAEKAGVAESTIKRMEQDEGFPIARGANIEAVHKALTVAGVVMVAENGDGPGVRLRKGLTAAADAVTGSKTAKAPHRAQKPRQRSRAGRGKR